jgi:hypothetical protein
VSYEKILLQSNAGLGVKMTIKNNRRRGKDFERRVARRVGGRRLGTLGGVDVVTDRLKIKLNDREAGLAIECKSRYRLPSLLTSAFTQCERYSGSDIPAVCLHETGKRQDSDLVVLRFPDFISILKALTRLNEGGDVSGKK